MTQLDIIAEQVKNYIDTICSQYQFVLKGNIYLHTPHEEVNLQILPTIDFKQHSDRKLGGFYDILTDEMDDVTVKSETFIDFFETICQRKNINLHEYWNSIKICIRNGYHIADASMWCDLVRLLRHFGKDTHCPKYVCPTDLKKAHDRLVRKREEQIERERAEQRREQLVKDEKNYLKSKGKFFGLVFTDNLILVKVIESVAEMQLEGKLMHHCVGSYHKRTDSLILSATIDGKRIETVEVSLTTFKVVQSRGVCNSNTEYHDRIISLVESNAELIRKRMSA